VTRNADMYNGSSPSRPSGIDYNGDAVHGVGIRRGEIDGSAGQFLRIEKISAGWREAPHLRHVMFHSWTAQMRSGVAILPGASELMFMLWRPSSTANALVRLTRPRACREIASGTY
jgi:hypothetical protein